MKKPKITYNYDECKFEGITKDMVIFWEGCFPNTDVIDQLLRKMPAWIDAHPKRANNEKARWKQFIVNWLLKEERDNKGVKYKARLEVYKRGGGAIGVNNE
jgi:hypothetical protein